MSVSSYKTKGGKVRWRVYLRYTDWQGAKRAYKKEGFALRREAQEFEREFLRKEAGGCDMSFVSLVELYRADAKNRVRIGTQETQDSIIDRWLLPFFGGQQVNNITPAAIRKWQNEVMERINPRTGKKYSETYLRTINSRLSAIMNYAVKYYRLPANPCEQAGAIGKKKAPRMNFWTTEEFNKALAHVHNWSFRVALMLLYWLGLRVGECLDLRPEDFKEDGTVRIERTHHRREGRDISGPPKTENSYRDVAAPTFLLEEVKKYISAICEVEEGERIFYFTKGTLNRELERVAAVAGVKRIRIHDLRHSHAALLIELGYSAVAVAERLGDTVSVAMGTYAHLYPRTMNKLAEELDGLSAKLEVAQKEAEN